MRKTVTRYRPATPLTWLLSALLGAAAPAQADDLALREATSRAGVAMFLNSGAPGLLIAVVHGDDAQILGFGETAPGSKIKPDGASIVRIGSVSKVFAGDLLAAMVAEGALGLSDPLSRYAPDGVSIQSFGGQPITLLDLATHSAGLPRELPDPSAASAQGNPFLAFRSAYYWQWLAHNPPAYAPGSAAIYSNLGFSLLGDALAKAAGKRYAELLQQRITAPLGMLDTGARLSAAQKVRLMTGLDHRDRSDPNWQAPTAMDASGGLYSSADDMLRWMRWHLANDAKGNAARALDHALWRPHDGLKHAVGIEVTGSDGMGLGWVVTQPRDGVPFLLGKSGGIGGFMSYVVISPNRQLGIFVVASRVNFGMLEGLRKGVRELAAELSAAQR